MAVSLPLYKKLEIFPKEEEVHNFTNPLPQNVIPTRNGWVKIIKGTFENAPAIFKYINVRSSSLFLSSSSASDKEKEKKRVEAVLDIAIAEALGTNLVQPHPNIVQLKGTFRTAADDALILVFERMDKSLRESIKKGGQNAREIKPTVLKLVDGLLHIHEMGRVHGDIKPANILVSSTGDVKYCDFEYSTRGFFADASNYTVEYRCPEGFDSGFLADVFCADVWALGITIAELYLGTGCIIGRVGIEIDHVKCQTNPRNAVRDANAVRDYITTRTYPEIKEHARKHGDNDLLTDFLIRGCLNIDAAQRLTAAQLRAHPYLSAHSPSSPSFSSPKRSSPVMDAYEVAEFSLQKRLKTNV